MGGAGETTRDGGPPPPAALRRGSHARGEAGGRGRRNLSRLFQEPDHRRNPATPASACPGSGIAGSHRRHVPGRQDQRLGEPRGASRRPARAARASITHDGQNVVPEVHAVLDKMAISLVGYAAAPGRAIRQAHPQCDQYRHRRIGSRTGHGVRSAEALQRAGHDLPLRLQRRWYGFRRGGARSRSRGDVVHHLLEDLHHAGDHDERA